MATAPKIAFPHITKNHRVCGGAACVGATRIRVLDIVQAYSEGYAAEEIKDLFAVPLTLSQVHSALAYADEYQGEITALYARLAAIGERIERDRAEFLGGGSSR